MRQGALHSTEADIGADLDSVGRHLWAENKAPSTITTYTEVVRQFTT